MEPVEDDLDFDQIIAKMINDACIQSEAEAAMQCVLDVVDDTDAENIDDATICIDALDDDFDK